MTANTILVICNVLMVLIWMAYLQLFLRDSKRRNRPFMLIHHAQSNDPKSLCMFVNMSKEPIHIQCVMINLYVLDECYSIYLTDSLQPSGQYRDGGLHEGPIAPGEYMVLGAFEDILLRHLHQSGVSLTSLADIDAFEVCVAAVHGPTEYNIGVRRRFMVETAKGETVIRAYSIHTEQLVTRKKRSEVAGWIERRLQPQEIGSEQTQQTSQDASDD